MSKRLRDHYQKPDKVGGLLIKKATGLTSRELEVIQLVAEGHANKQVASGLNISIKTVEKHRQHLMDKLNIHDTAGLTRYAIAQGIIESSVQVTAAPRPRHRAAQPPSGAGERNPAARAHRVKPLEG